HVARGQGQAAAAVVVEILDRLHADGGDIGSAVVPGAGALEEGPAGGAAGLGDPLDHAVGPLDGLDGDDIPVADGDRLADVQAQDLGQERPGELDVGPLLGRGG